MNPTFSYEFTLLEFERVLFELDQSYLDDLEDYKNKESKFVNLGLDYSMEPPKEKLKKTLVNCTLDMINYKVISYTQFIDDDKSEYTEVDLLCNNEVFKVTVNMTYKEFKIFIRDFYNKIIESYKDIKLITNDTNPKSNGFTME